MDAEEEPNSLYSSILKDLENLSYYNNPKNPGQLKKLRKQPDVNELVNYFSLGLPQEEEGLLTAGVSESTLLQLQKDKNLVLPSLAVSSGLNNELFLHHHWPPKDDGSDYIHLGPESFYIAREIKEKGQNFSKVLDLGCGMGVLSFYFPKTTQVVGVDLSNQAIALANFYKDFKNKSNISFLQGEVGSLSFNKAFKEEEFDLAVFNPPLAIAGETIMKHRDGGNLGIEIPLLFLDFSYQRLKPKGEAWFIAGDPLVGGKWMMLQHLKQDKRFKIQEYTVLEEFFNKGMHQKHKYDRFNIDHINLVLIKVVKHG